MTPNGFHSRLHKLRLSGMRLPLGELADPGLGFAVCNIIYGAKANNVALAAAFLCALLILGLRLARRMLSHPWLTDEAMSLRVLGAVTLASSLYTLFSTPAGAHYALLQGVSGLLFAVANFLLAAGFTRGLPQAAESVAASLRLPETWMAAGMLCLGLMAGSAALAASPFVVLGYARALRNIRGGLAEHAGHPKLWYAAATLCFAAISSDGAIIAANLLNAFCLVVLEHRLTPGGLFAAARRHEEARA